MVCIDFVRKIQIMRKVDLLIDDFERSLLMLDREEAERIFLLAAAEGPAMEGFRRSGGYVSFFTSGNAVGFR